MKPKSNARQVRFYPILPVEKRSKRSKPVRPPISVNDVKYVKRQFSTLKNLFTGSTSTWKNTTATVTVTSTTRTFQKNPSWRREVALGLDATYPYHRSVASVKPATYKGLTLGGGYVSDSFGSICGAAAVSPKVDTLLINQAVGRLKNKLNGYIGNAQVMAPLAESREIHRLVRQINGLGLSVVKSALAIKKTKGRSALAQFGDIWLGFGFGVNPMLKDIEKAANSILAYQTRQDSHVRVSGTASWDYQASSTWNPGSIAFGTELWLSSYGNHKQGVRIVAGVDLKIRSAASYGVTDHLGLEISEIPSTLWELVPYSWAVDYFSTVSPWLDDMFYTLPGVTKYISQTRKYQVVETWGFSKTVCSAGLTWRGSVVPGTFRYHSITRSKLASLPTRQLRFKTVDEIGKNGLNKLLNLSSVLAGRHAPNLSPHKGRQMYIRMA